MGSQKDRKRILFAWMMGSGKGCMLCSVTNCPQLGDLSSNSGNRNADFAGNAGSTKIALL